MPQMSPIYWFIMMVYFIFILMILIMFIYFFFSMISSKSYTFMSVNNFMNWMW